MSTETIPGVQQDSLYRMSPESIDCSDVTISCPANLGRNFFVSQVPAADGDEVNDRFL